MTRGGTLASADMAKLPLLGASFTSCLAKTTSALRPMTGTNSRRCHRRRGTSSSTFAITPLSASLQTGVLSAASLSNKPPPLWVHDLIPFVSTIQTLSWSWKMAVSVLIEAIALSLVVLVWQKPVQSDEKAANSSEVNQRTKVAAL